LSLEELERRHILGVMSELGGRVDQAARVLGIARSSLYARLKRYGVAQSEN
jgi:transcriptional regulator of acetoin/glycerol metabolism